MATSTYLQNSHTGTGSSTGEKATMSVWVKRTDPSGDTRSTIIGARTDDNNYFKIRFADNDRLMVYGAKSGSTNVDIQTNREFRDTASWLHIVLQIDTTNATETERVKWYVNGELQTLRSTDKQYPSQNDVNHLTSASDINIGCNAVGSPNEHFDGTMSHFHLIDGTIYAPTVFGSTDATTGEWKINTSPSITYTGSSSHNFFILKDGNSVTDQSGEGNNLTVGGGTLTKTEDCPSNVFATLNSLGNLGTTSRTVDLGNTKFNTSTTAWGNILSTLAFSSGKFYAEFEFTTLQSSNGYGGMGITDASDQYDSNDNLVNNTAFSAGVRGDYRSGQSALVSAASVVSSNIGNFSNGDIIGLAADMDNKALYIHLNGTYYQVGGVTGVPTSGSSKTGALTIPATCVDCMFFVASYTSDAVITANFGNGYFGTTAVSSAGTNASGNGIFEYDVPTGYTALSTKGLNI